MAKSPRSGRRTGNAGPGRLRIVAGKWRRRLLPVVDVPGLRPTSERVRETLFNWLAPVIDGARCLDLCAGSGALGFEAVSRGAALAVLVERATPAVKGLQDSAALLKAERSEIEIVQADARRFLQATTPCAFDIVFLDPPYQDALLPELCRLLQDGGWLAAAARVYLEHDRKSPLPELPAGWQTMKQGQAGNVSYCLLTPGGIEANE
jgi:16S rRNA (guanine966-N2)-methyltransferase